MRADRTVCTFREALRWFSPGPLVLPVFSADQPRDRQLRYRQKSWCDWHSEATS